MIDPGSDLSSNAFVTDKPETSARSSAAAQIERLTEAGGVFVEAVRATRMPMAVTDPSSSGNPIVFANDAFLGLSGYSMEEVLGRQPYFMNGAETDEADAIKFRDAIEHDRDEVIETVQYRKDGSRFVAAVFLSAFKGKDGRTLYQFLTYLDVTSRVEAEAKLASSKASEETLRRSEERYRAALRVGRIGSWETDFTTGIRHWSPEAMNLFGLDLPEGKGQVGGDGDEWRACLHSDHRALPAQVRQTLDEQDRMHVEYRIIRPDGRVIWLHGHAEAVARDSAGRITRMLNVAADITESRLAQEALREKEELLRRFGEASSGVLWIRDAAKLQWEYLSPAFEVVYGAKVADALAGDNLRNWLDLIVEEDRVHALACIERVRAGETLSFEYRVRRPDGGLRWLRDTDFPMRGPDGAVERIGGVGQDVTELKRIEAALKESEERFRSFAENSEDTLWIVDAQTHELEYLSPAFEAVWGESRERVSGNLGRWAELVHPADRERARKGLPRLLAGESLQQEYRIVRPSDGDIRWIQDTGFPIRDEQGRLARVGGVAQDVTDRKAGEEGLKRSRRSLRELIEGIPQLVWRAVDGGKCFWVSPQWTAFTGLNDEQSSGWGWLDAVHPDDQDAMAEAWETAARQRIRFDMECRLSQRGGAYRWFAIRAQPLDPATGDEHLEWLGTSTDIHELRLLQEQQHVLVRELHHRTRNLMAILASIARQTAARAPDLASFLRTFDLRLQALSRVQELLSRPDDEPITIRMLVELELDALAADVDTERVLLQGPDILVPRGIAQTLALALHELATNARKHGALSGETGRLSVLWKVGGSSAACTLVIEWIEDGRPPSNASAAPASGGYGRRLIEQALPRVLGAQTRFELGEQGVRCMIELPL